MRIAVVNWSARKLAGIEAYLDVVMSELARAGHDVALLCEADVPTEHPRIQVPPESPVWCIAELGLARALAALRGWYPDIVYAHGTLKRGLEAEIVEIAPAVFFAHNYYGTCISGEKLRKWPVASPCHRRFGWRCLLQYFPRRCGGLSPVTMLQAYSTELERQRLLRRYKMILTASDHVRLEYIRQGFVPDLVRKIFYPIEPTAKPSSGNGATRGATTFARRDGKPSAPWRLLFAGRMTYPKGGLALLEALPRVLAVVERPLRVTFAGDGPERAKLEAQAKRLEARNGGIRIEFTGWADQAEMETLFAESDLLVLPSLWPEPFGLIGPEAGLRGVPAAAFALGGIPEWLIDGVNGHLAPGNSPTSDGLAQAIIRCLRDPETHARLRRGAVELARQFSVLEHMTALLDVFAEVSGAPLTESPRASLQ